MKILKFLLPMLLLLPLAANAEWVTNPLTNPGPNSSTPKAQAENTARALGWHVLAYTGMEQGKESPLWSTMESSRNYIRSMWQTCYGPIGSTRVVSDAKPVGVPCVQDFVTLSRSTKNEPYRTYAKGLVPRFTEATFAAKIQSILASP